MKFLVAEFLLFSTIACPSQPVLSYEEGLAQCAWMREALTRENPNALPHIPPSCNQETMLPEFETTTIEGLTIRNLSPENRT